MPGPAAATVPYAGGAGGRGPDSHGHAAGSARCAGREGGSAGPGGREAAASRVATACIPLGVATLPRTLAFPVAGMRLGVRWSGGGSLRSHPAAQFSESLSRGHHDCVGVRVPGAAHPAGPGTWPPQGRSSEKMKSSQGSALRSRSGARTCGVPRRVALPWAAPSEVSPTAPPPSRCRAGCRRHRAAPERRQPRPKLLGDT